MYEKHGMRKTRLYRIWAGMKTRCFNELVKSYSDYGGRGIIVCEEWVSSFLSFADWANNNGYSDELTIERKEVNGNYEPSNCCWIPKSEQCKNRRNNRYIEINGVTKTLTEWSRESGLGVNTIDMRVRHSFMKDNILGYLRKNLVTINEVVKPIERWARENNLCSHVIRRRIKKGYDGDILLLPIGEFNAYEKSSCACS